MKKATSSSMFYRRVFRFLVLFSGCFFVGLYFISCEPSVLDYRVVRQLGVPKQKIYQKKNHCDYAFEQIWCSSSRTYGDFRYNPYLQAPRVAIAGDEFIGFENSMDFYQKDRLQYRLYFHQELDTLALVHRIRVFESGFCTTSFPFEVTLQTSWSEVLNIGVCSYTQDIDTISVVLEDFPVVLKYYTRNIPSLSLQDFPWKHALQHIGRLQTPDEFWIDWEYMTL